MLARVGPLPSGWSTMLADARAVALPDGWADVVTCSYLLHLLDRAERVEVLAEARRLLRPEASSRLIVVTVWSDERRPGGRLISGALRLAARAADGLGWPAPARSRRRADDRRVHPDAADRPSAPGTIGPLDDVVAVVLLLRYAARAIPRDVLFAAWPAEPRLLERLLPTSS